MAYRITYGQDVRLSKQKETAAIKAQCLMAAALFFTLLVIWWMMPEAEEAMVMLFVSREGTATEAMADVLCSGGTLRQGLIIFCRRILECAGYGV